MSNILKIVLGLFLKLFGLACAWAIRLPIILLEKIASTIEKYSK